MSSLFFQRNEIEGLVPVWMWNNSLETLQVIDLLYNSFVGFDQHPNFLPWVRLKMFIFTNSQLRGRLPIPSHNTVVYDVSNNNVIGEIPPLICEVKSLRLLDLSSNNMSGTLPPCLGSLSNSLSVLNLKRNNFHGTMMDAFTHGSRLKTIDLSENRFHGQISKSLANCTNLEVLFLGDNSFDDVFPIWLEDLPELQVLILRSNKFHGAIEVSTNVHSTFPMLRIIDLSNNRFTGPLPDKYFQNWNAMKSSYLGKSPFMQLEVSLEVFVQRFPYSMTITNKGFKRDYPHIFGVFTAIDLSSNNFEGEIPRSLPKLSGLESLNLSNNHLTGFVHSYRSGT
ncbi:hypothetical protein L6452_00580 [Arctium lappa]|uniref:Uncharacterized protein n=1 Tax=Arctium lappa TaxID=4217 RepID=A0ACB9FEJ7_ARCLA|nr:hypothetical protein L6452_00580 [Arctium lappa]